jgi:hypothetical protein
LDASHGNFFRILSPVSRRVKAGFTALQRCGTATHKLLKDAPVHSWHRFRPARQHDPQPLLSRRSRQWRLWAISQVEVARPG